ncbi:transcription factor MYB10 [Lactuca sativa]|uniref:Uncharacterized protein n=1 Tax=Lactuca sativa TaxID=4236 RepID=A0A9R1VW55_LACSA|nr:transcription factor MYB10 [Lactuca sativa]KAJ0215032.1 hypothetical protein LSAT_V11C300118140 [Lactuca sativa]
MVKAPCFDKDGIKKGAWSEEEDSKLRLYIERHGHRNWRELPKLAGLSRCGKSCRLRWMNYLRPNLRRGKFTKEEDDVIFDLHKKLGSKWSVMAAQLPGRSDNEIKNHWHTHLKNHVRKDEIMSTNEHVGNSESGNPKGCPAKISDLEAQEEVGVLLKVLSSGMSSSSTSEQSQHWLSDSSYAVPSNVTPHYIDSVKSFWTEPFLLDNDEFLSSSDNMFSPMFF